MIGLRRMFLPLTVVACLSWTAAAQDIATLFDQGVEQMRRGSHAEALVSFKKILASDPSNEEAYELFNSTDHRVWMDLLVQEGEFELVAKRMMGLAEVARTERRDDPEAIRELLSRVWRDDPIERRAALRQLSAEHGEFAVPHAVPALADPGDDDRRVLTMVALTQMSTDVVLPLIEALDSSDPYLRRNVALVLGHIADPRARGALAHAAQSDPDGGVRDAAAQSLDSLGGGGNALTAFLAAGSAYHFDAASLSGPVHRSSVVWDWSGTGLVATPVPASIYNDELAKKNYYRALDVDPTSEEALGGIARSYASEIAEVEALDAAGEDVGDLLEKTREGLLAVYLAGSDALDGALSDSVANGDVAVGIALSRTLGRAAAAPTPGLATALHSGGGALRSEAALALAQLSLKSGTTCSPMAIAALGSAAGRSVLNIVKVIDADARRGAALQSALESAGTAVYRSSRGGQGLAMLSRVPGVDAVVVSDTLPDLTTAQVLNFVRSDGRFEGAKLFVMASDTAAAEEIYAGHVEAILGGAEDAQTVVDALEGSMNPDRHRAADLAVRCSKALAHLASAGHDLTPGLDALSQNLDSNRPDEVALPSLKAMGIAGGSGQVEGLVSIVIDEDRSDEVRAAAGHALATIFGRGTSQLSGDALTSLQGLLDSDASLEVRSAAAHALGSLDLAPTLRAELLRRVAGEG